MNTLDIIGLIYKPTGRILRNAMGDTPEMAPIDGYHVNALETVAGWEAFEKFPTTPNRIFGGCPTVYYTFADEAEFLRQRTAAGLDPVVHEIVEVA